MDAVAFATWLLGVRCLDASQRGRAFQELALAEEHDAGASHKGIAVAAMTAVEAEAVPSVVCAGTVNAASGQDLLSQIGQGRLASFGSRIAVATTFVAGARPAASPGIAA